MPTDPSPGAEAAGFSDSAFKARYGERPAAAADGAPVAPAKGSGTSAGPRSRNSTMRTRARRLGASRPG